jgi:hypothetical protein
MEATVDRDGRLHVSARAIEDPTSLIALRS